MASLRGRGRNTRLYWRHQDFLVGRGAIDNKGPSIAVLAILEAAAEQFDGTHTLDDWTLEVVFNTSEETQPSIPSYLSAEGVPYLGVAIDAFWCIRAEKGVERPILSTPLTSNPKTGLWISDFHTPNGPVNQIAVTATASIKAADIADPHNFAANITSLCQRHLFDDTHYQRAPLTVALVDGKVLLTTQVLGAQHGSAADENRYQGANPAISLANFLAGLIDDGVLNGNNGFGHMVRFIEWSFGTYVFVERHPALLQRDDAVFEQYNGTSYALTRVDAGESIKVKFDIRYAQGHHNVQ